MTDQRHPDEGSAPPGGSASEGSRSPGPKRRHRGIVWFLIALASVLLVFSITANWIQSEVLDTDRVVSKTEAILGNADVREALATYTVDQLYANVDVRGELEERLPSSLDAFAGPAAAATRQLALDLQLRALASPRVQDLVSSAVRVAHEQFIDLVTDEAKYVATTDGVVTLEYGQLIADLASRLGVSPDTIARVQGLARDSQSLEKRLTQLQSRIGSVRATLSQVEQGQVNPDVRQRLLTVQREVAEVQGKLAALRQGVETARQKAPSGLQGRLAQFGARVSNLEQGLAAAGPRIQSALEAPSRPNISALNARLGNLEAGVTALLGRQIVQNPGELVVVKSTQLDGVQTLVRVLRNLGFVLPPLVLLLYIGALYLARGWRPRALLAAGGGILAAALLVLVTSRLIGTAVVDSVAGSGAEPAVAAVWEILSEGLRERTLFVLVIGLAFLGAGLLAGRGRRAAALRRLLAPHLRDRPAGIYAAVGLLFLLGLSLLPEVHVGQVLAIVVLAVLAIVGIEALRRSTAREFPPAPGGP